MRNGTAPAPPPAPSTCGFWVDSALYVMSMEPMPLKPPVLSVRVLNVFVDTSEAAGLVVLPHEPPQLRAADDAQQDHRRFVVDDRNFVMREPLEREQDAGYRRFLREVDQARLHDITGGRGGLEVDEREEGHATHDQQRVVDGFLLEQVRDGHRRERGAEQREDHRHRCGDFQRNDRHGKRARCGRPERSSSSQRIRPRDHIDAWKQRCDHLAKHAPEGSACDKCRHPYPGGDPQRDAQWQQEHEHGGQNGERIVLGHHLPRRGKLVFSCGQQLQSPIEVHTEALKHGRFEQVVRDDGHDVHVGPLRADDETGTDRAHQARNLGQEGGEVEVPREVHARVDPRKNRLHLRDPRPGSDRSELREEEPQPREDDGVRCPGRELRSVVGGLVD
ncbi:hypothetical protein ON010_g18066 [Phytophthora cinnamomi]|nr:hypothetical protein ON010_g18066 [Phytophthora cinnamomi]